MSKILLILQREYVSRVKKRSFLLTTFLTPLLFGGLYALAIYFAVKDSGDEYQIKVVDESGYVASRLEDKGVAKFEIVTEAVDSVKKNVEDGKDFGLLYIPKLDLDKPDGIMLYAMNTPGLQLEDDVDDAIEAALERAKMDRIGISQSTLDSLRTKVSIKSVSLSGKAATSGNSSIAGAVGTISGILIYMFMLVYGAQVMRGVMQEKTSKIVEILVSSVKPFQLMMGKILGVALVGLTQFVLWILLTGALLSLAPTLLGVDAHTATEAANHMSVAGASAGNAQAIEAFGKINNVISQINLPLIIGSFIYYFLTGYLFYAALFAMVGSAVDSEADTQQLMLPIMMPIIASFMMLGAVLKDPSGSLAFWLSMIPFSSPIIMMIRIPFDVPVWQLALSMALMILGFLGTTWVAGRVYRIGILMHGAKVNYKVIFKWLMSKQ
ncbi:MAG: ABC transporter permease [Cyclobacteriaceae bacterium]|nr:ABC transporter permease [Cyclobacteriaceae bacterium]